MAVLAIAIVAALLSVAPARAAFPGGNGLLVVVPTHGSGLVLVSPRSPGTEERICTSQALCGLPGQPRFAPDGSSIAFADRGTGTPLVVGVDGTCLWCLLAPPLSTLHGAATFTGDGLGVGVSTAGGLWRVSLTGSGRTNLARGAVSAAVWSARGAFAFVRRGWIWISRPGRAPRRLAMGASPAFSPDGARVVFSRSGWIWIVASSGGRARRLVRGRDPVPSPDGHELAFIGAGGRVYVAGAGGRNAHVVPRVRARSLDWQPVPRHPPRRCGVPGGSTLVAQTSQAVVTANPATPFTPWYGCLLATGVRRPLLTLPVAGPGFPASLVEVAMAGRFVAAVTTSETLKGNCVNAVTRVDLGSLAAATQLYSHACDAGLQGIDGLGLDTSGFAAWRARERVVTAQPLVALACPRSTLCLAADAHGNVASSSSPASGPWSLSHVAPGLSGLSCLSAALCIGWQGGSVVTTTTPTGTWNAPVRIDTTSTLTDAACATSTTCVAVDAAGNALSFDPATPGSATVTPIDPGNFLTAVSCPRANLCVAVDGAGNAYSGNPASPSTWISHPTQSGQVSPLTGLACAPGTTQCIATTGAGAILATANVASPSPAWTVSSPSGSVSTGAHAACAATSLCAVSGGGAVLTSSSPLSGPWSSATLAPALDSVACAPGTGSPLCAATDSAGDVLASAQPLSGAASWQRQAIDVPPCGACVAEQLYVQDSRGRQAVDSAQPGAGAVLGSVALTGNGTTVTWTHAGTPESYALR